MKFTFAPESRPLDGYTIKRAIYRGGFGEVYYALTDAGREVALKLLQNNSEVELRGVQQCLNLSHPNLATIFDVTRDRDGDHWIVMEYVAGETLDAAIHRHPSGMPMEEVRNWLRGMAEGVAFLHDQGIVHRDLKPGNVFSERGNVKIGDVGLSKFITPSRRSAQTQSVGTVYYMAPEVAKGRYGREVDVYALGIILYEMTTGHVPFDGESTGEILMKHLSEQPDLTKLPPRLQPVIGTALQKDPARRFATVRELQQVFEAAVIGAADPRATPRNSAQPHGPRQFAAPPQSLSAEQLEQTRQRFTEKERAFWHPTWRALLWMLAIGTTFLTVSGYRGQRGMAVFLLGTGASFIGYTYLRRLHPRWSRRILAFADGDTPPVGRGPIGGWISIVAIWVFLVMGMASADLRDLIEVGLPLGLAMLVMGAGLHVTVSLTRFLARIFGVGWESPAHGVGRQNPSFPTQEVKLPPPQPVRFAPRNVHQPARHYYRQRTTSPNMVRAVSLRSRMTQYSTAATFVVPIIALLTGSVAALSPEFFMSGSHAGLGWENVGLFGCTAVAAAWVLMGLSKWNEGRQLDAFTRRLLQMAGGVAVGAAAFWLGELLLISPTPPVETFAGTLWSQPRDPAFVSLGTRPLILEGGRPSLLGYVAFFGTLFGLRRWWWQSDAFRPKRFRVGSVVLSVFLAFLVSTVWTFPQVWAMTWAAVISSAIQLASIWTPPEERFVGREV